MWLGAGTVACEQQFCCQSRPCQGRDEHPVCCMGVVPFPCGLVEGIWAMYLCWACDIAWVFSPCPLTFFVGAGVVASRGSRWMGRW